MKCPRCGNELAQGEAFCGQCGTPNTAMPPTAYQPVDRPNIPAPRSGLLSAGAYSANTAFPPSTQNYQPGTPLPSQFPNAAAPAGSYQQSSFHHDATEAMSPVSGLLPGYHPQSFVGTPQYSATYPQAGQFTSQEGPTPYPFQTGNYNYAPPQPAQQQLATGQGYDYGFQGRPPLPPQKQSNQVIIIVCITLVIILIGAIGITTFVLLNHPNSNQAATIPAAVVPTTAPTAIPTAIPTPVPTIPPTPTAIPTPAPDAGFTWCSTNCSQNGFMTEFPANWQGMPATNSPGVQFANPAASNIYAAFKTPGATGDAPTTILMKDAQSTFGSQPGYQAPPQPVNATIGGAPWYAVALSYNDSQNQNQKMHVEVYATVYQGKAYIIELQAPDANNQFDAVKQQSFVNMLVKFQFLPTA